MARGALQVITEHGKPRKVKFTKRHVSVLQEAAVLLDTYDDIMHPKDAFTAGDAANMIRQILAQAETDSTQTCSP